MLTVATAKELRDWAIANGVFTDKKRLELGKDQVSPATTVNAVFVFLSNGRGPAPEELAQAAQTVMGVWPARSVAPVGDGDVGSA